MTTWSIVREAVTRQVPAFAAVGGLLYIYRAVRASERREMANSRRSFSGLAAFYGPMN